MYIDKIILFGRTGMLGNYIHRYFSDTYFNDKIIAIDYRIVGQDFEKLEKELIKSGIDANTCVINCIGLIPQRKREDEKEYYAINSLFPHLLWELCKKYKAKMIQPSTDCVFSGRKGGYTETDYHDEINAYGSSKSLGEPSGATIIRTSIIGRELHNKKSFLEWILANKNINGFTDHYWNGITCLEYCKVIEEIITKDLFWAGVRHIFSPEVHTKYEMAQMIANTFELNSTIEPVHSNSSCDKSLKSIYSPLFNISPLCKQLNELKHFNINI